MNIAFFGSSQISIHVLEELKKAGIIPSVIVTTPDMPKGRKMILTPTMVKVWANNEKIPVLSPNKLDEEFIKNLSEYNPELIIVASYGKIIPKIVLDFPKYKCLNVHPSLLPKYRGASPLQYTILNDDRNTGVTIIRMDEGMDSGPIVAQINHTPAVWPIPFFDLKKELGEIGGKLLAEIIPKWVKGEIPEIAQNQNQVTYTKKINKADAEIKLENDGSNDGPNAEEKYLDYKNYLKYCAFKGWPNVFYFKDKNRIIVNEAEFIPDTSDGANHDPRKGKFNILEITPEGKTRVKVQRSL